MIICSCYSFFNNFVFFLHDYYDPNNVYSTWFGRLPQILGVSAHVYVLRKYTILVFYPSMLLNSLTFLFSYVCMWSTANGRDSKFNLNSDHEKKKTYFHMSYKVFDDDQINRAQLLLLPCRDWCVCSYMCTTEYNKYYNLAH